MSLNEKIDKLSAAIEGEKKGKEKKIGLGFFKSFQANRTVSKKSKKFLAFIIERGRKFYAQFLWKEEGYLTDRKGHHWEYNPNYVILWKGRIPCVIIAEHQIKPLINIDEIKDNMNPHVVTLTIVQQKLNELKKSMGGFIWFIIIGVVIVAVILLFGKNIGLGGVGG